MSNFALKSYFIWCPKAKRFKSGDGYAVKRKARLNHVCRLCNEVIKPNQEYYQLRYYRSWITYPICENCWNGENLSAYNKAVYKETDEFATEGRGGFW